MADYDTDRQTEFEDDLDTVLVELKILLLRKNSDYNDSALRPKRYFSKLDAKQRLFVRIDDKLNRYFDGAGTQDSEDTLQDLAGYVILSKIWELREKEGRNAS